MEGLEPPSTRFQAEVSAAGLHPDYETTKWWERESNSRHPALQASALPTELSHQTHGADEGIRTLTGLITKQVPTLG